MARLTEEQIDKLLEDISLIKSVIGKNKPLLRHILMPGQYRLLTSLIGASIIVFSMLFYFLVERYGDYGGIPTVYKILVFGAIAADYVFLAILKHKTLLGSARKIKPGVSLFSVWKEFFTSHIMHVYIPLSVLALFLCIYFPSIGRPFYLAPTLSIGMGLIYNILGGVTGIRAYLIAGYWLLTTGFGALFFSSVSIAVVLSLTVGCGMIVFAIASLFPRPAMTTPGAEEG